MLLPVKPKKQMVENTGYDAIGSMMVLNYRYVMMDAIKLGQRCLGMSEGKSLPVPVQQMLVLGKASAQTHAVKQDTLYSKQETANLNISSTTSLHSWIQALVTDPHLQALFAGHSTDAVNLINVYDNGLSAELLPSYVCLVSSSCQFRSLQHLRRVFFTSIR